MSDSDIVVELEERSVIGKGLKKLRSQGKIPAVIHDHGNPSMLVMADHTDILKAYSEAGKHHPVQLHLGNADHLALIKEVDFESVKHQMRHVVFQAIKQNVAVEAEIPVVFKADVEIPAEKISLMVLRQLDHVEVKALPKDLPDELVVDPSVLVEVGDHVTVADLIVPEGVTVLTDPDHPIATVEMPKDQEAEANAAAAEQAAADAEQSGDSAEPTGEAQDDDSKAAEATKTEE
jgi:large subunit ribosomal protein L25